MSWSIEKFESDNALVQKLSASIAAALRDGVKSRGSASLAVSGGNTPKPLFEALSNIDLPWEKVVITLVDERWVDSQHPDSNARLVAEHLLQHRAAAARFVPLKTSAAEPFGAEPDVERRLQDVPMPFDVVVLGMGDDGHTASFFPGAAELRTALQPEEGRLCCAVHPPSAPHNRMTLTLPAITSTKHLVLHVVGRKKWQVLQRAIQDGRTEEMPIRAVLHQMSVLLDIYYAAE